MRVRSDKEVKVGLLTWDGDFVGTAADWGNPEEVWLPNGGWLPIRTCRRIGEVSTGMLRVEGQGTYIDLDTVCVEFGTLPHNFGDWPYFDGDNLYGASHDFSWYERPHKSYSCWYNDRDAVMGRLFAWNMSPEDESPGGVITDEEAAKQGLARQWVPVGIPVQRHLDVLFPEDPRKALPPVNPPVMTRAAVPSPWFARGATAGTPGTWTPTGWLEAAIPPESVEALRASNIRPTPLTQWTAGQYVQTGTSGAAGRATWTGTRLAAAPLASGGATK